MALGWGGESSVDQGRDGGSSADPGCESAENGTAPGRRAHATQESIKLREVGKSRLGRRNLCGPRLTRRELGGSRLRQRELGGRPETEEVR